MVKPVVPRGNVFQYGAEDVSKMRQWLDENKKWFFSGAGVFIVATALTSLLSLFSCDGKVESGMSVSGNNNVVTKGDGNSIVVENGDSRKIAVVEILEGVDVHLGDNVYPGIYGTSHNPLNTDIFKQGVPGLIYYDKQDNVFLADVGRPTIIGQALVDHMEKAVSDVDLSCYAWVRAYEPGSEEYENIIAKGVAEDSVFMLGPTALVASDDVDGNFYERYAAVGIVRSFGVLSECTRAGIDVSDRSHLKAKCVLYCYHGGIRSGQAENFILQLNDYSVPIPSKTRSMRDTQQIVVDIPLGSVNFDKNNTIYVYVLPWVEEYPRLHTDHGDLRPAHFRDVGITYMEVQVVQE